MDLFSIRHHQSEIRNRARGLSRLRVFPKGAQMVRNGAHLCAHLWRFFLQFCAPMEKSSGNCIGTQNWGLAGKWKGVRRQATDYRLQASGVNGER